ncbi:MAG TPA: hypothetical protein VFM16_06045 [Holophagaceae bacterium]|nr:hypothetical protein [Holophagaceae bacterium]
MYDAPRAPLDPSASLPSAPGARGAKLCGIWSLVASATCVGLPIGIVLAIVALVQSAKARRLAREYPEHYAPTPATGLVLGIIGLAMPVLLLPFIGIVSAIAIPALLSQRARARDLTAKETMIGRTGDLALRYDQLREANTPPEQIPAALETLLQQTAAANRNPWTPSASAVRVHIEVVTGLDRDAMEAEARSEASELGQAVWVLELPAPDPYSPGLTNPGYLAGAVRLQMPRGEENPVAKVVDLE